MSYPRVEVLLIDKEMNTVHANIPTFMLNEIYSVSEPVQNHDSKRELNTTINEFLSDK